uniref:DFDF domain-containing protein n=1 Tax=Dendroctonus ponderosae TaxID=77166 RepID=A0AAR5QJU4_DENPD
MTTGMPELGSKISLISKADIRYEGRLFTVDPQECTIALASVRSFGTEERDTQFPVPAQNQVYDYILFRGSDIKDIRIMNNVAHAQPLNDPAIMQLSVPPSLGAQQYQQHPILGHMAHPPYGSFLPMGGLSSNAGAPGMQAAGINRGATAVGSSKPIGPPSSILSPPPVGEQPPRSNEHSEFMGGVVSRSTTPASMGSRKSGSVDQGTQAGNVQKDGSKRQAKPNQQQRGPPQARNRSGERRDSQNRGGDSQEVSNQNYNQGRAQNRGRGQQTNQYNRSDQYNNRNNQYNNRGGWNNQRGVPRGRGRPKAPFRPGMTAPGQGGNKRNTLKFDSEYDFEQANTEFEELRSKFAKAKIEEAGSSKAEVNGAPAETEKKEDSGNETGAGEPEQEEDQEVFYDKTKSFFDKISCEAAERAKGKLQRTDWRQERKLNSETFGVAATRRGSYRGRGGYRGGFRGGYRGGYRYPQQRKPNEQQQTNQQSQQGKSDVIIYSPLTSEEAVARNAAESMKAEDNKDVIVDQGIPVGKINFDDEKDDLPDNEQTEEKEPQKLVEVAAVAATSSACVGQ